MIFRILFLVLLAVGTHLSAQAQTSVFDIRSLPDLGQKKAAASASPKHAESDAFQQKLASIEETTGASVSTSIGRFGGLRTLTAQGARLSRPDPRTVAAIARDYVDQNRTLFGLDGADLGDWSVAEESGAAARVATLTQRIDGIPVFRGSIRVATDAQGRVLSIYAGDVAGGLVVAGDRTLSAQEAAIRALGLRGTAADAVTEGTPAAGRRQFVAGESRAYVQPAVFPMTATEGRPAYSVLTYGKRSSHQVVVAADDGRMLYRASLKSNATFSVWTESPDAGPRETVEVPDAWFSGAPTSTRGSFVDAFVDADGNDFADPANSPTLRDGRASSPTGEFNFQGGDGLSDSFAFPANAAAHGFYHVNRALEYFASLGFDEATGGFGAPGLRGVNQSTPGDPIEVHVLDGAARGGASLFPAPDGISPILDAGVILLPDGTERNFALSAQVMVHETTHAVMERLVGGVDDVFCTTTVQADALGEGISDYMAASYTNNPVIGGYVSGDAERGLRRAAYDQQERTGADFLDPFPVVHDAGEIIGAALWNLREELGAQVVDALVVQSFSLMPCDPNFIDFRDALLAADEAMNGGSVSQGAGSNAQTIWAVFAARGFGEGAEANEDISGGHLTLLNSTTDLPTRFGGTNGAPVFFSSPENLVVRPDEGIYQVLVRDPEGKAVTVTMTDGPDGASFNETTRIARWQPNFSGARFEFTAVDADGVTSVQSFFWLTGTILETGRQTRIDGIRGSQGIAIWALTGEADAVQFTTRGGMGDSDLSVFAIDGLFEVFEQGTDETVTISDPTPGFFILVYVDAFDSYDNVLLSADRVRPTTLTLETDSGPYIGPRTSERIFRLMVPAGTEHLRLQVRGAEGDADILAAAGRIPSCQAFATTPCDFDAISENDGSYEALEIDNPTAGEWFVTLYGFTAFRNATVTASTTRGTVRLSGATEAAGFAPALSLLGISTLFGEGMSTGVFEADQLPIPNSLDDLEIFVNGQPAGQFFLNGTQSNFQYPAEAGLGPFSIVAVRNGVVSSSVNGFAFRDVPRMFAFNLGGQMLPVVTHADGSVVTPDNPARPGETLVAYFTGLSSVTNRPETGMPALADPLSTSLLETLVEIGGQAAATLFSGWTPGFVALGQVNFAVHPDTPSGLQRFVIRFGGLPTQDLEIPVERE